jgi:hypothetical protein
MQKANPKMVLGRQTATAQASLSDLLITRATNPRIGNSRTPMSMLVNSAISVMGSPINVM